jgi:hypothetical protein
VYGDAAPLPAGEDAPKAPISPYGAAKLASEALLLGHAAAYGFTVRCQRYFNVFGPRQDPGSPYSGVISLFARRHREGTAVTLYGDGGQTRDFISVHDVARANVLAATAPGWRAERRTSAPAGAPRCERCWRCSSGFTRRRQRRSSPRRAKGTSATRGAIPPRRPPLWDFAPPSPSRTAWRSWPPGLSARRPRACFRRGFPAVSGRPRCDPA